MKPPLGYFGSKAAIADRIAALLPEHEHYVEPFAGSLAVLFAKPPSQLETVNDLDSRVAGFWKVLRDRPADLERVCALTPHSRAEYLSAYEPSDDELEEARRTWIILTQGRAGTLRRTGWRFYADPAGARSSMPAHLSRYVSRFAAVAGRLASVSLECRPALDVIKAYGAHPGVLLYADPPYPVSVRHGTNYRHEMPGDDEHRELAAALSGAQSAVVVSGYGCPLYDTLYDGWHRAEIATTTGQGSVWKSRTEVLWSNRPFPQASLFEAMPAEAVTRG